MKQLPLLLVLRPITCHCTQIWAHCCCSPNCNQTDKGSQKTYRGRCAPVSRDKIWCWNYELKLWFDLHWMTTGQARVSDERWLEAGRCHPDSDHILGRFLGNNFTRGSHLKVLLQHPAPAREPQCEAPTLELKRIRATNSVSHFPIL